MMIITIFLILIISAEMCSTDLSFLSKMKRLIGINIKDNNLKGTFKTLMYLGTVAKIFCFGKKYPAQNFRRYSWFHSGKRLDNNKHYSIDKYGTLSIHGATVEDSGEFVCQFNSKAGTYKFKHYITVIQFPSKSLHIHFVYTVQVCSEESKEFARHFIESKVKGKICSKTECQLSYIHSACHFQEFDNPNIRVTVPIMVPGVPNGSCTALCLREKIEKMKFEIKQSVISAVMHGPRLKIREEPSEMSVSYLEAEDDNICNPGFEMKGSISRSLCIPCAPGQFLEKGYCIPCRLNHYNEKYAATECRTCFGHRVTRSRGATSEEDCYLADSDVLWILLGIIIIIFPFILVCCCWSFIYFFGETVLGKCIDTICLIMACKFLRKAKRTKSNEEDSKQAFTTFSISENLQEEAKSTKSLTPELAPPQRRISDSTFVIPSVRHSSGRDFFYRNPSKSVARKVVRTPPPPALPTDSMLKRASKNMAYQAATKNDKSERNNTDKPGTKPTMNDTPKINVTDLSNCRGDVLPYYSERILKNPPMYNAFMKTKA